MNKIYPSDTEKSNSNSNSNAPAYGIEREINTYGTLVFSLAESIRELQDRLNPVLISRINPVDARADKGSLKEVSLFTANIENNNNELHKLIDLIQEIKDSVDF